MKQPTLEQAAQQIAEATSKPPFLYDLGANGARKVLDDIQAAPVAKLDVDEKWITVSAGVGDVHVRIVKPVGAAGPLPTIFYVHDVRAKRRGGNLRAPGPVGAVRVPEPRGDPLCGGVGLLDREG